MKLSANEETLLHEDVKWRPPGFIMHTEYIWVLVQARYAAPWGFDNWGQRVRYLAVTAIKY